MASINLIGRPYAVDHEGNARQLSDKAAALLAIAVWEPSMSRRRAAALLWPNSPESIARNNLRTLTHRILKTFNVTWISSDPKFVGHTNSHHLTTHLTAEAIVERVREGGARRCEPLYEVDLDGLDELTAWVNEVRDRMQALHMEELERAFRKYSIDGPLEQRLMLAECAVQLDPLAERWWRRLMELHSLAGNRPAALLAYEKCREVLKEALGTWPEPETRRLQLLVLQHSKSSADFSAEAHVGVGSSPLIGRDELLSKLLNALAKRRHVAVRGEAGVGKSSFLRCLAVERSRLLLSLDTSSAMTPYCALERIILQARKRCRVQLEKTHEIELARAVPAAFPDVQPLSTAVSRSRLRRSLVRWIGELRTGGISTLIIDDLQNADVESQSLLVEVLADRHDAPSELPIIVSYRSCDLLPDVNKTIERAMAAGDVLDLLLPRLGREDVRQILTLVSAADGTAALDEAMALTGGNPLFVMELYSVRDNVTQRFLAEPRQRNIEVLLRSRVNACSVEARSMAYIAAVAEREFSIDLCERLLGKPATLLLDSWLELKARGLFDDYGLAHDLVRSATRGTIPALVQRALHEKIATFLEEHGQSGAIVQLHWQAANRPERAFPHALRAYEARLAMGLEDQAGETALLELLGEMSESEAKHRLWAVAGFVFEDMNEEMLGRVSRLVDRVESFARDDEIAVWIATVKSLAMVQGGKTLVEAHIATAPLLEGARVHGVAKCWFELHPLRLHVVQGGPALESYRRAQEVAKTLPDEDQYRGLKRALRYWRSRLVRDAAPQSRALAAELRRARAEKDVGAIQASRLQLATVLFDAGRTLAAYRFADAFQRDLDANDRTHWFSSNNGSFYGMLATFAGRYSDAFEALRLGVRCPGMFGEQSRLWLALCLARRGCNAEATAELSRIDPECFKQLPASRLLLGEVEIALAGDNRTLIGDAIGRTHEALLSMGAPNRIVTYMEFLAADLLGGVEDRLRAAFKASSEWPSGSNPGWRTRVELSILCAQRDAGLAVEPSQVRLVTKAIAKGIARAADNMPNMLLEASKLLRGMNPVMSEQLAQLSSRWGAE